MVGTRVALVPTLAIRQGPRQGFRPIFFGDGETGETLALFERVVAPLLFRELIFILDGPTRTAMTRQTQYFIPTGPAFRQRLGPFRSGESFPVLDDVTSATI
jgi:hypothetical protein